MRRGEAVPYDPDAPIRSLPVGTMIAPRAAPEPPSPTPTLRNRAPLIVARRHGPPRRWEAPPPPRPATVADLDGLRRDMAASERRTARRLVSLAAAFAVMLAAALALGGCNKVELAMKTAIFVSGEIIEGGGESGERPAEAPEGPEP